MQHAQQKRLWFQAGFFILFLLAPVFDLFRFDLNLKHFFFLGMPWTLGLDDFLAHRIDATQAAINIILRGGLPILGVIGSGIWISWKYGRLYCGWLCPHFSVVETVNDVLRRATARQSIWDKHPLPERNADCDNVCPMRIKPRAIKRHMFACTQCGRCAEACSQVQAGSPRGTLLKWVDHECALDKSARDFGHHETIPPRCFEPNPGPKIKTIASLAVKEPYNRLSLKRPS